MKAMQLRRALALGIVTVAVLNTVTGLSLPRPDMKPPVWRVVLWLILLLVHAAGYWFDGRLRQRVGDATFIGCQAAIVFAVGMTGAFFPVGAGLYIALTVYAAIVAGPRWGSIQITFASILLFAINAILTSNVYRGATIGLLLAVAGLVGHSVAVLVRREQAPAATPPRPSANGTGRPELTARENEVLEALARGARNSEIASELGITERTVKAHLASIYTKLGVESRTAAVATLRRNVSS